MDAEQIIVGQALQDNTIAIAASLTADMFTVPDCRKAWSAIISKVQQGGTADMLTLADAGLPAAWVSTLTDYPVSNWRHYAGEVRRTYAVREIRKLGTMLADAGDRSDPQEVMNSTLDRLQAISHVQQEDRPYTLKELAGDYLGLLEHRYTHRGTLPGIESGLQGLDKKLLGFEDGKYYVFGARPSQGKSALLVTIFGHMIRSGVKVGMLSLESSRNEILDRLVAQTAKVDGRAIKTGTLTDKHFTSITHSIDRIMTENAVIYDEPNVNIGVLQMQAKYMQQRHGVQAILVDYIQIARAHDRTKPKHEQIAEVSMSLKQLSRELRIPVIVAAQLRRDSDGRRPSMSDLGGSGQIEQDADGIGLIYHEEPDNGMQRSWIILDKNRDGVTEDVPVYFKREYAEFIDRVEVG